MYYNINTEWCITRSPYHTVLHLYRQGHQGWAGGGQPRKAHIQHPARYIYPRIFAFSQIYIIFWSLVVFKSYNGVFHPNYCSGPLHLTLSLNFSQYLSGPQDKPKRSTSLRSCQYPHTSSRITHFCEDIFGNMF